MATLVYWSGGCSCALYAAQSSIKKGAGTFFVCKFVKKSKLKDIFYLCRLVGCAYFVIPAAPSFIHGSHYFFFQTSFTNYFHERWQTPMPPFAILAVNQDMMSLLAREKMDVRHCVHFIVQCVNSPARPLLPSTRRFQRMILPQCLD